MNSTLWQSNFNRKLGSASASLVNLSYGFLWLHNLISLLCLQQALSDQFDDTHHFDGLSKYCLTTCSVSYTLVLDWNFLIPSCVESLISIVSEWRCHWLWTAAFSTVCRMPFSALVHIISANAFFSVATKNVKDSAVLLIHILYEINYYF